MVQTSISGFIHVPGINLITMFRSSCAHEISCHLTGLTDFLFFLSSFEKFSEPILKTLPIRPVISPAWQNKPGVLQGLQSISKHRTVYLMKHVLPQPDDEITPVTVVIRSVYRKLPGQYVAIYVGLLLEPVECGDADGIVHDARLTYLMGGNNDV
jgi:hypothetical protein